MKLIHFIWVGNNPLPGKLKKNIEDCKRLNPEYKIILWDNNRSLQEYSECEKYLNLGVPEAYLSNWLRLRIIRDYGGWYIDIDYQHLKSLPISIEELSKYKCIVASCKIPKMEGAVDCFFSPPSNIYDNLINIYIPDHIILKEWNDYVIQPNKEKIFFLPQEKVSSSGTHLKNKRMYSFKYHDKFYHRLKEINGELTWVYKN